jgi:ATP-dependent exoDNAse (exonuclease V) beta subunit
VTFTNKATEEMKSRILKEINDLVVKPQLSSYIADLKRDLGLSEAEISKRAKAIRTKILHDYSRFTILTIDKFFQRILRAFIKELGLDINYNIELDTATILARSTDSLIDEIPENEELQRWIMEFAQENIDDNSAWDIRREINDLGKALFNESSKQAIQQSLPR